MATGKIQTVGKGETVQLTPISNGTGTIRIQRYGALRTIFGTFTPSASSGTFKLIATVADIDKPPYSIYAPVSAFSLNGQCEIQLSSSGELLANITANNNGWKFCFSYMVTQ